MKDAPTSLANRADALRVELERVRHVEQTWESVRQMVDEKIVAGVGRSRIARTASFAWDFGTGRTMLWWP